MAGIPTKPDPTLDINEYLNERLEKEISWHGQKARHNKFRFRSNQIIIMIGGALIPIINILDFSNFETRLVSSILGGLVLIITGISQLEKYQQNWLLYRTTAELLKKEKWLFRNNAGPYHDPKDKDRLLVERVESIVSAETSKYFTIHQPTQAEVKGNT